MLVSAVVLVPVMGVILFLIGSSEVPGVDDIDLKEAFVLNLAKVAVWAQLRSQVRGSSSSSRAPFRSRPAWEEACKPPQWSPSSSREGSARGGDEQDSWARGSGCVTSGWLPNCSVPQSPRL